MYTTGTGAHIGVTLWAMSAGALLARMNLMESYVRCQRFGTEKSKLQSRVQARYTVNFDFGGRTGNKEDETYYIIFV